MGTKNFINCLVLQFLSSSLVVFEVVSMSLNWGFANIWPIFFVCIYFSRLLFIIHYSFIMIIIQGFWLLSDSIQFPSFIFWAALQFSITIFNFLENLLKMLFNTCHISASESIRGRFYCKGFCIIVLTKLGILLVTTMHNTI